jgi:anti-sigma B factor antagonist
MAYIDVALDDDLDLVSASRVKSWLSAAIAANPGGTLRLDMAEVDFLDSTGLGLLMGALLGARSSGGDVLLARANPAVTAALTVTGLDRVFSFE